MDGLSIAILQHLHSGKDTGQGISRLPVSGRIYLAIRASLPVVTFLTIGVTFPGLMWFTAITMSSCVFCVSNYLHIF
jgi:hypothetical protein